MKISLDVLVIIFCFSFNATYLDENNGNLSETKLFFCQHVSQHFLKMRKFLLHMSKEFLIMSNLYLVEILSEPNSLTIVTSKKILKMSNYVLILSFFFLIMRIRNLQCNETPLVNLFMANQTIFFGIAFSPSF